MGAHGAYDMMKARKKLGDEIVENDAVYNPEGLELIEREFPSGAKVAVVQDGTMMHMLPPVR